MFVNEIMEYFLTDNLSGKKCTEKWLMNNNEILFNKIINWCDSIENLREIEFKRKVYHYITKMVDIPTCKTCGGDVKYSRIKDGYRSYCSNKCVKNSNDYYNKWLDSWKNNNSDGKSIEKRNKTLEAKYGKDYDKIIQKNRENVMLKKHGVSNSFQISEIKKKRKETLNEKYGSETYNNPDKTKRTRIDNNTQINDEIINDFLDYKKIAVNRTITIYRNNENIINPEKFKRSKKDYHIDHLFSIKQGFLENLPIEIISHPCNLHMIFYMENLKKQDVCWITKEDLLNNIILYNNDLCLKQENLKQKYSNIKEIAKQILDSI